MSSPYYITKNNQAINILFGENFYKDNYINLPWVKVQNFQNPELLKLQSSNVQYAH